MSEILGLQTGEPDEGAVPGRSRAGWVTYILFTLFCIEIGIVLVILPWTPFWDNNFFFGLTPQLDDLWLSNYLRGGISGIGLVNIWIGLGEAWRLWK
jgi:hypothetical protein